MNILKNLWGLVLVVGSFVVFFMLKLLNDQRQADKFINNIVNNTDNEFQSELLRQYIGRNKSQK